MAACRAVYLACSRLGHLHTLIHEMGHVVSHIALTGGTASINLSTRSCLGSTTLAGGKRPLSPAGETFVDLSSPLADIIFSSVLAVGVFALTHYVPMPLAASISLKIAIAGPAIIWILGELLYAAVSAFRRDEGDFGKIVKRGFCHFLLAVAALVAICALCALGMAFL